MNIQLTINQYHSAFNADSYVIQLVHEDKINNPPLKFICTPEEVIQRLRFLQYKNAAGYNIYSRPVGYQYVLIDDVKKQVLDDLEYINICLIMETSPANYQAFLILPEVPSNRETARDICRQVCESFSGDFGSAEPDHVGRLPGFTNRKEKHRNEAGLYPYVKLHKSQYIISNFLPRRGLCAQDKDNQMRPRTPDKHKVIDRSRQDFNTACMLIRQKKSDEYIRTVLESTSEKAIDRKDDYIGRTIRNARNLLKIYN